MSVLESTILFFVFIGIVILLLAIKKFYYRFYLKKKFNIIPRVNIKGITNIGMMVALSIAILILLTIVTADLISVIFRAWPGTRIILEGILIKIGGMLFGPIIGLCIGAATDFLTISLTAGVFHIGYFISAMFFGLIGGIIKYLVTLANKREFLFAIFSSILLFLSGLVCVMLIYFIAGDKNLYKIYSFSILNNDLKFYLWQLILTVSLFISCSICFIWILYYMRIKHYQNYEKGRLIEETYYSHFNDMKLFKINYLNIKKLLKSELNKHEIKLLAIICSHTTIQLNQIKQLTSLNNIESINHLMILNYIDKKNNEYQISSLFNTLLLSSSYQSLVEKHWIKRYEWNNKHHLLSNDKKWFMTFTPIFVCIVLSEIIINIMMIPSYDELLSTLNYDTWLLIRVMLFVPMVILNLIVIFPIFKIITPNIKLNIIDGEDEKINKKNILQK